MKIVVWPPSALRGEPTWPKLVEDAAGSAQVAFPKTEAEALAEAPDADGWVGGLNPALLAAAKKLRWLQSPSISLENTIFPELAASDVIVTNMRQTSNSEVATHALMHFLMVCRDIPSAFHKQMAHIWKREGELREIDEMTVLIMGLGGIGKHFARLLKVHDPKHVIGVDPFVVDLPEGVDELATPDKLPDLLPRADGVIVIAPLTPDTMGLFDEAMFRRMKPSAYFVNVGRGQIVKTAALERALREGWIARAGLDVVDPEPLPPDNPLWDCKNFVITSHTAVVNSRATRDKQLSQILENIRIFVSGKPFPAVVRKDLWF